MDFLPLTAPGIGLKDFLELSLDQDKWEDSVLFYMSLPLGRVLRMFMLSWQRNQSEQEENAKVVSEPVLVSFLLTSHLANTSHTSGYSHV